MELTHQFTVPAGVDEVWETLLDLERVGGCFPGATVTEVTDDGFSGTVKVKLGPIALVYAGSGSFLERDAAAHRAVIDARGKDKRGNGTAGAKVTMQLTPDGDATQVDVVTDLAITGKPAQFGRGVMQDVSDKLLRQFVDCIESQFAAPAVAEDASPASPDASESPATEHPSAAPATAAAAAPSSPARAASSRPAPPPVDDAIDLGAVALPSAVRQWGPYAAAAVVGVVLGYAAGRRR
ncbi:SRPBCC family protein [Knoellia subterranea]|uniref:Carbon monoxide dehydrogenase subunit G (CoxG) family protein n=1 Tax=Knoellia subterranea KCTC 19937 TaxID=1385521 RepID=A0A0A0JLE7_9MICO|nr:SRPBCC family protein [Knoellia subterranea]KGN38280.1 carbon monoxide dehydrogenase subunit G (CoxG) family protein [Knoellia subterranea KCTC 19937]